MRAEVESDRPASMREQESEESAQTVDEFIRHRFERLTGRLARDRNVPLDEATMGEVQFLRDLTLLARRHRGRGAKRPKRQLVVPLLVGLTILCITALVFLRLPSVRVDVDALTTGVTFRTASQIQLTGISRLTLFQATEFAPVDFEDPETLRAVTLRPPMELRPEEGGSLTLSSVTIPQDTLVSIQTTSDAGTWRVSIEHASAAIAATAAGPVNVATSDHPGGTMAFGRGSLVQLRAATGTESRLDFQVTPQRVDSLLAGRRIPVRELAFEEPVQEAATGAGGIGMVQGRASSVIEGSIFNVSLASRESRLRAHDTVEMSLAGGEMRELRLEPQGVRVSFSGVATELQHGRSGELQTLRPSYLAWLAEYHALQLAWGSMAWLFALFLGGVKWWREFGS